ncbi:hypothetical protein BC826DRAFT_970628 [Russula brevipes]|nr:hypothetical protein BC826DRAFT_970628 [Russula brevipes]
MRKPIPALSGASHPKTDGNSSQTFDRVSLTVMVFWGVWVHVHGDIENHGGPNCRMPQRSAPAIAEGLHEHFERLQVPGARSPDRTCFAAHNQGQLTENLRATQMQITRDIPAMVRGLSCADEIKDRRSFSPTGDGEQARQGHITKFARESSSSLKRARKERDKQVPEGTHTHGHEASHENRPMEKRSNEDCSFRELPVRIIGVLSGKDPFHFTLLGSTAAVAELSVLVFWFRGHWVDTHGDFRTVLHNDRRAPGSRSEDHPNSTERTPSVLAPCCRTPAEHFWRVRDTKRERTRACDKGTKL